jgi:hypothetical protein
MRSQMGANGRRTFTLEKGRRAWGSEPRDPAHRIGFRTRRTDLRGWCSCSSALVERRAWSTSNDF